MTRLMLLQWSWKKWIRQDNSLLYCNCQFVCCITIDNSSLLSECCVLPPLSHTHCWHVSCCFCSSLCLGIYNIVTAIYSNLAFCYILSRLRNPAIMSRDDYNIRINNNKLLGRYCRINHLQYTHLGLTASSLVCKGSRQRCYSLWLRPQAIRSRRSLDWYV